MVFSIFWRELFQTEQFNDSYSYIFFRILPAVRSKRMKYFKLVTPVFLLGCFIPFLILCFYCFPSVDDYSFANITDDHGYLGAQIHWYTTWTGRYFSTAILSISPILLKYFLLYQLVSFLVFIGSLHSLYFLVESLSPFIKRRYVFTLSLACLLAYISFIPDITEAYYWFPGSATYQLACIFVAYLCGLGVRLNRDNLSKNGGRNLILMCLVSFAVVGCNEVAMTITILSLSVYYASSVLSGKGFFNKRILIVLSAAVGSGLIVFAPGNNLRAESDLGERGSDQIWEAFTLSLSDALHFIGEFIWLPLIPLIVVGMLSFSNQSKDKFKLVTIAGTIVLIFILVLAATFPTYYIYKIPPPLRTQNFALWVLVLGSIYLGRLLAPLLSQAGKNLQEKRINIGAIGFLIVTFIFSGSNGVQNAYADLISGSALEYKKQYKSRSQMLAECSVPTCTVPAYTIYPFSTFHSDLETNADGWWNYLYGKYNGGKKVSIDYSNSTPFYSGELQFEPTETVMENYNLNNLSDSVSYDGGFSYHMAPDVVYGGGINFTTDTIDTRPGNQLAYLEVSGLAKFADSLHDLHLVAVIVRPGDDKPLSWSSVTWENPEENRNGWLLAKKRITLYTLNIHPDDKFKIFLWNPNGRDANVANLSYNLY